MACRCVLVAILAVIVVAAEQASYTPRVRRRPMLSPQDGPDSVGAESEQEQVIQGPPSDFNPSPQIPDGPRSENEPSEIGGLTVQDPPKGWPFSDMALQEKFQEQMMQDETGQRQVWSEPPEQVKPARQVYRQGRVLDGNRQGRKEPSSREQENSSGEQQTYREYSKKKRIVKPSHSHGTRIRQSVKQYQQETTQEDQGQQYHQEMFEQQKHIEQQQFSNPEQVQQQVQQHLQQHVQQHEEQASRQQREQPKKHNKRRPTSAASTGGPSAVSVGYSINFENQESGLKNSQNPLGIVQNEVVHGEGAVSYSNAQIGAAHPGQLRITRPNNANSIDGRPIYVPPIASSGYNRIPQQNPPYNFPLTPVQSPEHESLPSPAALIGEQEISNGNYVPETISVVKSTNPFELEQRPESPQIITQFESPQGLPAQYEAPVKPTKPPTILHINDGTDFKWKNLGNGVEISAPITPNGLQGGYRESIPIQEDNEEDTPLFDNKPALFAPDLSKTIPSKPVYNHNIVQSSQFDESNGIFPGQSGENIDGSIPSFAKPESLPTPQGLISNHIIEDQPKIPFPEIQNQGPPPSFNRRPNIYNHNFGDSRPEKGSEDLIGSLGFPKFPEMNKIYYLPSGKPGISPIPAVAMPLSVLKQITGALDSQSVSHLGQDISTADFMKMLTNNDVAPESPLPFPEQRPVKQRPHGFNPNKGHQNNEGHVPNRGTRNHHRYQQSFTSNKYNTGPYGVKVTKSVPLYEQHSVAAQTEAPWNTQSQKHMSQVQHYNVPLEAFEALRPNAANFKGRPGPNHYNIRDGHQDGFAAGSGRQQYRLSRQNGHQQNREMGPQQTREMGHQQSREMAQADRPHGDRDGESFAVSSSYRIGPSARNGWKQGRN